MRDLPTRYESLEFDALMAQAKVRARVLRRQAVSEFWEEAFVQRDIATRSLTRFLNRLKMHRQFRVQASHETLQVKDV